MNNTKLLRGEKEEGEKQEQEDNDDDDNIGLEVGGRGKQGLIIIYCIVY